MKKINKYIIVCMLSSLCLLNTVAQTKGNISDIRSNWYIEMGVGAQVCFLRMHRSLISETVLYLLFR